MGLAVHKGDEASCREDGSCGEDGGINHKGTDSNEQ